MGNGFDKDIDEDVLDDDGPEHTSVTMKLAIIQQRCADLLEDDDDDKGTEEFGGLSLADDDPEPPKDEPDPYDPYGR